MSDRVRVLAETIWRYHQLQHQLSCADVTLVLCSRPNARFGPD